jgi:C-terminal processing protease CtpA/Prc
MLKDIMPNCITIGKMTKGGGGGRYDVMLPNGWILSYPDNKYFCVNGENMEYGLMPDIYVKKVNELNNDDDITREEDVLIRAIEVLDSINSF